MLSDIISQEIFAYLLIMTRLGACLMFIPALGDNTIPARVRVTLAMALTLVVYLVLHDQIPLMPIQTIKIVMLLAREALIGMIIGLFARLLLSAVHTAGTMIAMSTGLAAAQSFDPTQGSQSAMVSTLLTLMAVTLIFVTDIHHQLIWAMVNSYNVFPIGFEALDFGGIAGIAANIITNSFALGVQLAAPFIVYSLIFYVSMGILVRMMPQLPVFFVAMPLNVALGLWVFALVVTSIMQWFIVSFEDNLSSLFG